MLNTDKDLKVWQMAYKLTLDVYRVTKRFPLDQRYGLSSQMQRAALSVPSNIAEGYGRRTRPDYLRSLFIANGSLCGLETQVMLAVDLGYLPVTDSLELLQLLGDVERMLKALIRSLERPRPTS
jgi:four helix bundle protein